MRDERIAEARRLGLVGDSEWPPMHACRLRAPCYRLRVLQHSACIAGSYCTAFNATWVPMAAPGPGTGQGKEKNQTQIHARTMQQNFQNKLTDCPPYNLHPAQSTTYFHCVSRHTDAQNKSVVVAIVNILHICWTISYSKPLSCVLLFSRAS